MLVSLIPELLTIGGSCVALQHGNWNKQINKNNKTSIVFRQGFSGENRDYLWKSSVVFWGCLSLTLHHRTFSVKWRPTLLGYAHCALRLSRLLEAVPDEPCILPDQLRSVVVKRAARSTFIYIVHSSNKETIDSFLISSLLDKGWDSFDNS